MLLFNRMQQNQIILLSEIIHCKADQVVLSTYTRASLEIVIKTTFKNKHSIRFKKWQNKKRNLIIILEKIKYRNAAEVLPNYSSLIENLDLSFEGTIFFYF